MQFQHTTEHGVTLIGNVGRLVDDPTCYMVVLHEETLQFYEQVVFIFRAMCGHPALTREFSNEVDYKSMKITEKPLEFIIPKRLLTADLPGLRNAAATAVTELIEYSADVIVIEPSAKFKSAMRRLLEIKKNPQLLDGNVPPHLRDYMHSQFELLLDYLRQAPNAMRADQMAETALEALQQYNIPEAARAELKLN